MWNNSRYIYGYISLLSINTLALQVFSNLDKWISVNASRRFYTFIANSGPYLLGMVMISFSESVMLAYCEAKVGLGAAER